MSEEDEETKATRARAKIFAEETKKALKEDQEFMGRRGRRDPTEDQEGEEPGGENTASNADLERRMKQLEEEREQAKTKGEKDELRREIAALRTEMIKEVRGLREEIRNIPVVDVMEGKQIYEAEAGEELTPCPKCQYGLTGTEDKCPSCGEPLEWTDQ